METRARSVAEGVHRIEDAFTNWFIVEDAGALTVVDAGVPSSWGSLQDALRQLGRSFSDIRALILTHAHFDHVGFAERLRREHGVTVWLHENDVSLARNPTLHGRERARTKYMLTQVRALPIVASLVRSRAFWPRPVEDVRRFGSDAGVLPVPGSPEVVFTPGHTLGHCAFHFPDRDVLLAGDALVMLDPYTAKRGPRLVARAATADSARARESLDAIAATDASVVVTGHGEPWTQGARRAAEQARAAGIA